MTDSSDACPFGPKLERYWARLSPLERRMRLTEEGLYSLAPQVVMEQIASYVRGEVILDAFCGAGGSAIGFARAGKRVVAVDTNPAALDAAAANAALFGVDGSIEFLETDALHAIETTTADAIFLDPPWGGPDYSKLEAFKLANFQPDGYRLIETALARCRTVVIRLPKNFDLDELKAFEADAFVQRNHLLGEFLHFACFLTPVTSPPDRRA